MTWYYHLYYNIVCYCNYLDRTVMSIYVRFILSFDFCSNDVWLIVTNYVNYLKHDGVCVINFVQVTFPVIVRMVCFTTMHWYNSHYLCYSVNYYYLYLCILYDHLHSTQRVKLATRICVTVIRIFVKCYFYYATINSIYFYLHYFMYHCNYYYCVV